MKIERILKFTRTYKGLFDERISTWLFRRYIRNGIHSGITWFNNEDIAIYYSSKEYIERRIWMLGEYEQEVKSVFNFYVPNGATVLDIGANIGVNTLRLSKCVGANGKVYSFEPIPFNQNRFRKNIELNKVINANLVPFALGLKSEKIIIEFNETEENMGAVSLRNTEENGISIQVKNGDEWVKDNDIQNIDFMKIDVEGFEWNVISGLSETIKRFHPKILIEWDLNYLNLSDKLMSEWQRFIDENNFKIYQINRYDLVELNSIKEAGDGNLLFV